MSKTQKKSKRKAAGHPASTSPPKEAKENRVVGAMRGWVGGKRPVMGFVLGFGFLMALFYAVTFIPYVNQEILPAYMRFNARASAVVINIFGEGAKARGTSISSPRFSVDIKHGCDAVAPSMLFVAAVLAFPGSMLSKVPGVLIGTFVLALINLIRIISLFYTGIFYPRAFEVMHVDVWQPAFILLALVFWVVWAWRATSTVVRASDEPPEAD